MLHTKKGNCRRTLVSRHIRVRYELIALDLDDTVLNSKKKISKRTKQAIEDTQVAHVPIVVASGRAYGSLKRFADELGIQNYAISLAGGLIHDPDGNVIHGVYLDPEIAWMVMNWCASRGVYYQVYTEEGFFYPRRVTYSEKYERVGGYDGHEDPSLPYRHDLKLGKILVICEEDQTQGLKAALERDFPALSIDQSAPFFIEISDKMASKGEALCYLAEHLGVPQSKVLAIGDSEIDVTMIKWAGMGIAMKNSVPAVLEAADYVTDTNNKDGVAKALDKFVLSAQH